jgi:hypothetical protein
LRERNVRGQVVSAKLVARLESTGLEYDNVRRE